MQKWKRRLTDDGSQEDTGSSSEPIVDERTERKTDQTSDVLHQSCQANQEQSALRRQRCKVKKRDRTHLDGVK